MWLLLGMAFAAQPTSIDPGTFVVMESGWAQIDVTRYVMPAPVEGHSGRCVVSVYRDNENGDYIKGTRDCPDPALEKAALTAANLWAFDVTGIYYFGQTGGITLDFSFDGMEDVQMTMDERWIQTPLENRPKGVITTSVEVSIRAYPKYPKKLRGTGEEAVCIALIDISDRGKPNQIQIKGCEDPFAAEATKAAKRWRWTPPQFNGQRRDAKSSVKFNFQAE
jgi:hypothetical protein